MATKFTRGDTVRLAKGCIRGPQDMLPGGGLPLGTPSVRGVVLGDSVFVGQLWTPILWEDAEDPEFFKTSCLEFAPKKLARNSRIVKRLAGNATSA